MLHYVSQHLLLQSDYFLLNEIPHVRTDFGPDSCFTCNITNDAVNTTFLHAKVVNLTKKVVKMIVTISLTTF